MKAWTLVFLPGMLFFFSAHGQSFQPTIENIGFKMDSLYEVTITYDLIASPNYRFDVEIFFQSGNNPPVKLTRVNGKVGRGVLPGRGLQAYWNPLLESGIREAQGVRFLVEANFLAQDTNRIPEMVRIPGGIFYMGTNEVVAKAKDDRPNDHERPVHPVHIGDFFMGKYEVTVAQFETFVKQTGYRTVAERSDTSYCWMYDERKLDKGIWKSTRGIHWRHDELGNLRPRMDYNHPVVHIAWEDAQAYVSWLNVAYPGRNFRLPSEAEWEYAAANGTLHTRYSWGDDLPRFGKKVANVADESRGPQGQYWSNSPGKIFAGYKDGYYFSSPVGWFEPNLLGLYDMIGNVWEFCQDYYGRDYYQISPIEYPQGPTNGQYRCLRGGCWNRGPDRCRVADRSFLLPTETFGHVGFRIASSY